MQHGVCMSDLTTQYYERTAHDYDALHAHEPEHIRALERAWELLDRRVTTAIEVGCGTGRVMAWLKQRNPSLYLCGVDPAEQLLKIAHSRVPSCELHVGSGERLPFADGSFDLALATGVMHHADRPDLVIREMFRVARRAVLISDHNNFAFGDRLFRRLRLFLYSVGLLGVATFVKQGFRRQGYSKEDGWWYPYSILNDYSVIASLSEVQYIIPTRANSEGGNLLLSQSHMAILALKTGCSEKA